MRLGASLDDGDARPAPREPRPTATARRRADRRRAAIRSTSAASRKHVIGYMKDFLFAPEQARTPVARAVGRRARPADAGAGAGEALQPPGAGRADQRPRPRDAGPPAGDARRLSGHGAAWSATTATSSTGVATIVIMAEGDGRWLEYAGGYSDMVAQRGARRGARSRSRRRRRRAARAPRRPPGASRRSGKLTFKEKHALETLPTHDRRSSQRNRGARTRLSPTPTSIARDPGASSQAGRRSRRSRRELAAAEEEWLTLEMLREELGG